RQVTVFEDRQERLGDERNDNVVAARLGADSLRHRVLGLQLAAQEVLDDYSPQIFGLADHRADSAFVEELHRVGIAADVESAHHHRHAERLELQRDIAPARILVGLHAGKADQQLDAVLVRLFLDGPDGLGADYAVADFVPNDGLEINVALGGKLAIESLVQRCQRRERVIRLHAVSKELNVAFLVIARGLDEVDSDGAARLGFQRPVLKRTLGCSKLQRLSRTIAAVAIRTQQQIQDHRRDADKGGK